jgi:Short C-terminal domain
MLRRRPIARMAVGTAVVAGTATAVSGHVARGQAERAGSQQAAQAPMEEAPVQEAADPYEQLKQLGDLHAQGILTDEEFAAEKAKILG